MAETDWPDWNVYVRDGCKCVYCGFDGTKLLSWFQLEIDHLIPVRSQGADWPENKVVTCVMCNKLKHGYDPGNGRIQSPSDPMNRQELIEKAKSHINKKRNKLVADFGEMMAEIKKRIQS